MSKKSEEAALKVYPYETGMKGLICENSRGIYIQGYKQAEKDTIERAVAWLKDYVKYFELYDEKGVEEFKKSMEEE